VGALRLFLAVADGHIEEPKWRANLHFNALHGANFKISRMFIPALLAFLVDKSFMTLQGNKRFKLVIISHKT
jgi:hypothetical protein